MEASSKAAASRCACWYAKSTMALSETASKTMLSGFLPRPNSNLPSGNFSISQAPIGLPFASIRGLATMSVSSKSASDKCSMLFLATRNPGIGGALRGRQFAPSVARVVRQ